MTNNTEALGLIELVQAHAKATSVAEIARRSGGRMTPGRIYSMLNRGEVKQFPNADTIEGLAAGMGVPVAEVVLAAARSLGIPAHTLTSDRPDDLILFGAARLSDESQALIRQTAEVAMHWEGIGATTSDPDAAADALSEEALTQDTLRLAAHEDPDLTVRERLDAETDDPA